MSDQLTLNVTESVEEVTLSITETVEEVSITILEPQGPPGPKGDKGDPGEIADSKFNVIPNELPDGSRTQFTLPDAFVEGSLRVYVVGTRLPPTYFNEDNPSSGIFSLVWAIDSDENIITDYIKE